MRTYAYMEIGPGVKHAAWRFITAATADEAEKKAGSGWAYHSSHESLLDAMTTIGLMLEALGKSV